MFKKKKSSKLNFFPRLRRSCCSPSLGEDRVVWRRANDKHKYRVWECRSNLHISYFPFSSFWILKEETIVTAYEGTTLAKLLPTGLHKANLRVQQDDQRDLQSWDPENEGQDRLTLGRFSVRPACRTLPLHTLTVHVWSYAALKASFCTLIGLARIKSCYPDVKQP